MKKQEIKSVLGESALLSYSLVYYINVQNSKYAVTLPANVFKIQEFKHHLIFKKLC